MTGAAFTQTPVAGVPTSSKGPIVIALLAGVLVLGGGAAVAAMLLRHDPPAADPATAPSVAVDTTASRGSASERRAPAARGRTGRPGAVGAGGAARRSPRKRPSLSPSARGSPR